MYFFASVYLFDPAQKELLDDGLEYAGEARLFVSYCDDLIQGLKALLGLFEHEKFELLEVLFAGDVSDFEPENFPFEVDIAAITQESIDHKVCVSTPGRSFKLYKFGKSGICLGLFEIFDCSRPQPYGGEFFGAACEGSPPDALKKVLDDLANDGVSLRSIDGFYDTYGMTFDDESREVEELVEQAALGSEVLFSTSFAYETEQD